MIENINEWERAAIAETVEASMVDTCEILELTSALNDYGEEVGGFSVVASTKCGFSPPGTQSKERQGEGPQTSHYAGRLRLPLGVAISENSRVRITHRKGRPLVTPLVYEVKGPPVVGTGQKLAQLYGVLI